uniref:3Beta_HSD domain-containing protein n=1 Tax=Parastrongyloides trichosuri TaxID=131310 RepID=A0A0N4ZC52_PARTI
MSNVIAITGASGVPGQHLVKFLQEHPDILNVTEIKTIDIKLFNPFTFIPKNVPMKHYQINMCDEEKLLEALDNVTAIFHLAEKPFDYTNKNFTKEVENEYWEKNVNAVECLTRCIVKKNISNIVYMGNAYCNLSVQDNFGLSEDNYSGLSASGYILGVYGETKIRGEMYLRTFADNNLTENGSKIQITCLRPTLIYGEGNCKVLNTLIKLCKENNGLLKYIKGQSNGYQQFIYAGNLAYFMVMSMKRILDSNNKHKNVYLYVMDTSACTPIYKFFLSMLQMKGYDLCDNGTNIVSFTIERLFEYMKRFLSYNVEQAAISDMAKTFLFKYALGFADRKMSLYLKPIIPYTQENAFNNMLLWSKKEISNNDLFSGIKGSKNRGQVGAG